MAVISERDKIHPVISDFEAHLFSAEELELYGKKAKWCLKTPASRLQTQELAPHSREYFSRLRPVFLHQVSSFEFSNRFSFLLLRDGALSLFWFFYNHPVPLGSETFFLVNEKFANFVPAAWRKNVAFYCARSRTDSTQANPRRVYLIVFPKNERQCSSRQVSVVARRIRERFGAKLPEIRICTAEPVPMKDFPSGEYFRILSAILGEFGGSVGHAASYELPDEDLSGSAFVDLNEFDFYYSDSAVVQSFLSKGAWELFPRSLPRPLFKVDGSFHHLFEIGFPNGWERSGDSVLDRRFAEFRASLYLEIDARNSRASGSWSASFEQMSYEIVSEVRS